MKIIDSNGCKLHKGDRGAFYFSHVESLPSRKLRYATLGKPKNLSIPKCRQGREKVVPRRIYTSFARVLLDAVAQGFLYPNQDGNSHLAIAD